MSVILLALGLVLFVEGLAYALAPSLVEDMLAAMRSLSLQDRRWIGLGAVAVGTALVAIAHAIGV